MAAFASYIIYLENNQHLKASTSRRRLFLHQLSEQLTKSEIEVRLNDSPDIQSILYTQCNWSNILRAYAGVGDEAERDSTGRKLLHMLQTSTNKKSIPGYVAVDEKGRFR